MKGFAEWTFEGGLKKKQMAGALHLVGVAGNRTRYQSGTYGCMWQSGQFIVNLSGTAIREQRLYYRLRILS